MPKMMRNVLLASLVASAANAQSSMTYLNMLWRAEPTLTLMSSDAIATTYEKQCPTTTASPTTGSTTSWEFPSTLLSPDEVSSWYSSFLADSSIQAYISTHLPATTPTTEASSCVPFTMFQGPETWGLHLTLPEPGLLTKNGNCTWSGAFTEASITCDAELKGTMYGHEFPSGSTTVFSQEEFRTSDNTLVGFAVATVVMATPTATTGTTSETTGSGAGGAEATKSSGLGVSVPRPTGVVAMVGGAAAIGGAAWML